MAPHHGGKKANPALLAKRTRPEVVISSQGPPPWPTTVPQVYEKAGAVFLATWPHGAVTVRSRGDGLTVETHRTRRHIVDR
jgi:competence protein ComEC